MFWWHTSPTLTNYLDPLGTRKTAIWVINYFLRKPTPLTDEADVKARNKTVNNTMEKFDELMRDNNGSKGIRVY